MSSTESNQEFTQFLPQKLLIYIRGIIMLILGSVVSVFAIIAPNVQIMSVNTGWLPIPSFIMVFVGVLECFDTYISKNTNRFIINLQLAVLDMVFGMMILFSLGNSVNEVSLLIAAYLMVKGVFRLVAAMAGGFPHAKSTIIGGLIALILGVLIWIQWPDALPVGFLAFSLSLEIALRGFALLHFTSWLGSIKK